ncbi:DUF3307 domain-containing protein [Bowmanella denitrificans]|uniref:DUF3307 domain-containing protein n=1 Tax=Bowmanella denitrificans TaxID=366582 RepID=UPI000C998919|nr:DUF3307 domain-containing protein [Bowmanella denitrificans]
MDELLLLLGLLSAHLLGDFFLHPLSWINDRLNRHYRSSKLIWHALVHTLLSWLVLFIWEWTFGWGPAFWQPLWLALLLGCSHYVIDLAKSYCPVHTRYFLLDQCLHLTIILLIAMQLSQSWHWLKCCWDWLLTPTHLIVLIAYLLILRPSSVLIALLLRNWTLDVTEGSLPKAGHAIGLLERILILTFTLLEQFAGVGFLLAAKSVFRFGDLTHQKDRRLTEYVMLGTLLSVTISLLLGILTLRLVKGLV